MSFFGQYKKSIIGAIAALCVASAVPLISFAHSSWGDARYLQKIESIRNEIRQIDSSIFEIDQEISFAESDKEKGKWIARKSYYENLKEALREELEAAKE